jgi:3'-phosphoadenosine 5'-phosphosulfate sulfotransferase (PAPS reductase)/FAD synthetase
MTTKPDNYPSEEKIREAKKSIRTAFARHGENGVYVGHSGGKDSAVVSWLAEDVFENNDEKPHVIANLTDTEPVMNMIHLLNRAMSKHKKMTLIGPEKHEYGPIVNEFGFEAQIDGTRIDEGTREDKSADVILNGEDVNRDKMDELTDEDNHNEDGLFGLEVYFPIMNWSTDEVWAFIDHHNIEVSKEYEY